MSYTLYRGPGPLLVSVPHAGTDIPADQRGRYVERALAVEDTDWHLQHLWAFVRELGASLIVPKHSRYLIDLNRPRENTPMYPGANNTELCPTRFFTGEPLYHDGQAPDAAEIARRIETYWQPYHHALEAELARIRAAHGHAVLFDAHSIKSELPWLFEGTLPHLNLGTVDGRSCAPALRDAVAGVLRSDPRWEVAVDARFKGGHITRAYGRPAEGVHAVQLEMCWRCYLDESRPQDWDPSLAEPIAPLLRRMVESMLTWRPG